jgi:hypothetical protein
MNTILSVTGATRSSGQALNDDLEQVGFASRLCGRARLGYRGFNGMRLEPPMSSASVLYVGEPRA